ncbi:MAG: helix-turn-helix domain-containing protein [Oscillospiraceae bacterium]|nr:helix-turn-helix domain-containing protein [Oscillospiraceae bacterium]
MGIGKRLREARQSRNLKQDELAKLIGVTASAIANYENDISHPKEVVLYKLFEVLEVEPNFIFQDVVSIKKEAPSPTEEKLLQKVRKLNATGRKKADEYITDLSENPKYTEPRPLPDEVSKDIARELENITGKKRKTTILK